MNILSLYNKSFLEANEAIKRDASKLNGTDKNNSDRELLNDLSFKDLVNREIEKVNNQQIKADNMAQDFISGQAEDLHAVLIATEEARLTLELAVQIRNKCIDAYKEINNMQL